MMIWSDIACIVFACVTANHLGLISAIEDVTGWKIPVVGCVKCLTFWAVLGYGCYGIATNGTELVTSAVTVLAVSFLASYIAIWLELLEGFVDKLYTKCYDKIYSTEDDTAAADANDGNSCGSMP